MFLAALLGALFAVSAAAAETVDPVHSVRYFLTFTGKTLPFTPKHEVTQEKALASNPYCIVEYDGGRIVRFVKMLDGKQFFEHRFTYFPDGTVETIAMTRADGSTSLRRYDLSGNAVEESK